MKKIAIFKFKVFDESIIQKAKEVAKEFPGVTSVVEVEGERQLEVKGDFDSFELTKELQKIDDYVDTIKLQLDEEPEPEVKKPAPEDAGGSKFPTLEPSKLWEKAKVISAGVTEIVRGPQQEEGKHVRAQAFKLPDDQKKGGGIVAGVAEQAKVVAGGVAKQAKVIAGGVAAYVRKRNEINRQLRIREKLKEEGMNQRQKPQFGGLQQGRANCVQGGANGVQGGANGVRVGGPYKKEELNKQQPHLWKRAKGFGARMAGIFNKGKVNNRKRRIIQPQQGEGNHAPVGRPVNKAKPKKPEQEAKVINAQPQVWKRAVNFGARLAGVFNKEKVKKPQKEAKVNKPHKEEIKPQHHNIRRKVKKDGADGKEEQNKNIRRKNKPSDAGSSKRPTSKTEGGTIQGLTQGLTTTFYTGTSWMYSTMRSKLTGQTGASTQDQLSAKTRKKEPRPVAKQGKKRN